MRFFRDSPALTRIRWYFVPNDRPIVPYPTLFSSYAWDDGPTAWDMTAVRGTIHQGEQMDNVRPFQQGEAPLTDPDGSHVCGTREQWAGAMDISDQLINGETPMGWPRCCGTAGDDGLALWLNAHDLAQAEGDPVPFWPGRSPDGNSGLSVGSGFDPLFSRITSGLDAAVFFSGLSRLNMSRAVGSGSWTLYWVGEFAGALGLRFNFPIGQTWLPPLTGFRIAQTAGFVSLQAAATINNVSRILALINTPCLVAMEYDASIGQFRAWSFRNPAHTTTQRVAWPAPSFSIVGGPGSGTGTKTAILSEVIFWHRLLTAAEQADLVARMAREWSIPLV